MKMDRWQEIERLFLAASELAPPERAALLDRETAGDPELAAAVEGMLRHSDSGGTRFQKAVASAAVSAVAPPEPERTRIDRYTILSELGRGGMGAVYLAERAGEEFQQKVAIKVVKRGMDTAQIVERFRHERRILASLDHPNIARVLDGGATEDGAPYLVMEYIEGRSLIEYCRERALSVRERLRLFEQICAAVQHAHQKLVVHRDIKPANILVSPAGVPKLLDFGIAKILMPDADDGAALTITGAGLRLLTPDYASPEQVRGDPVSVATDVYSLGAVLYELLTGKRAHRLRAYTEAELALAICETAVTPPSQAAEDPVAKRELSGDLDNIVGLALRKDPARRYVSVEQFAGDIRRHLEGRPVLAHPESILYRARKFVSRNRVPAAAALLVLASLAGGIVATTLQARRADAQAARAERRFQQVRKLANAFVFDVYDGMANIPGTAKLRASVVATALEYLDSLAREAEGDTNLQMELAAAYKRIGDVQGNPAISGLGETPAALVSYKKASAILNRLAGYEHPDPKVLADLGNLERAIGFMHISTNDPRLAIEHLRKSVAVWERRMPQRSQDLVADTGVAQAWGIMGQALVALGESAAAVERHTAAVDLLRGWLARNGNAGSTYGTVSIMLQHLADARAETGDLAGAVETYRESAQMRKQIMRSDPKRLSSRRRLFTLNFALAKAFGSPLSFSLWDRTTAEGYATEALREAEEIANEDKGSARSVRDRMFGNWILGCVLFPSDARRAIPYLEIALELASKQAHDDTFYAQSAANAQEALAHALLRTGRRQRAIDLLRGAAQTLDRLARDAPQMIDARFDLIRVWNLLGDSLSGRESNEFYRKAYLAAESAPGVEPNALGEFTRASTNLRWPRWNPGAPASERRRKLELAIVSWQKLAARAPGNAVVQAGLTEARRLLASL